MPPKSKSCDHSKLLQTSSSHASVVGYKERSLSARISAASSQIGRGTAKPSVGNLSSTFPAPLVLPEDELSWDPTSPPQTYRSWIRLAERNQVTPERRTVYLVGPPGVQPGLEKARDWAQPRIKTPPKEKAVGFPQTKDVLDYLKAFYHGLPVKLLSSPDLNFTAGADDDDESRSKSGGKKQKKKASVPTKSPKLWLNTKKPSELIEIRTRATPGGSFTHQLNLNDLLDVAIDILPDDAFALLMLVEHDLFEDDDDDFACGRAYGGSRIAVVSGARYNPSLDLDQDIDREHSWPASHCERYVQDCCLVGAESDGDLIPQTKNAKAGVGKAAKAPVEEKHASPMYAALFAHNSLPSLETTPSTQSLSGLWLGRVARTAGHELGHCFGIDHCIYYACSMQGTASIIEDARQPPYLCPVDLAKVLMATAADEDERDKSILHFCERYQHAHLFASYAAWIRKRLEICHSGQSGSK